MRAWVQETKKEGRVSERERDVTCLALDHKDAEATAQMTGFKTKIVEIKYNWSK